MNRAQLILGDVLDSLKTLPEESVQCCVTSPPYFGLRDYGNDKQLGLEASPEEYVSNMVSVFREVRRVLRDDGTLWLNIGDSYNARPGQRKATDKAGAKQSSNDGSVGIGSQAVEGCKPKDLIGIPWMLAFALRADGWYLRQELIWHKPACMPESVTDRCTKSHEQIFLLTKSPRYFFDNEAIKEPCKDSSVARLGQDVENQEGSDRVPGKTNGRMKASCGRRDFDPSQGGGGTGFNGHSGNRHADGTPSLMANKRSVWSINPRGFAGAHFATFPPELPTICIKAGTSEKGCCAKCGSPIIRDVERRRFRRDELPKDDVRYRPNQYNGAYEDINGKGDAGYSETKTVGWKPSCDCDAGDPVGCVVLDPFMGSGTTGMVALEMFRNFIGIELNPDYFKMSHRRMDVVNSLFNHITTKTTPKTQCNSTK